MTIRQKIGISVSVALVCLIGILYVSSRSLVMKSFLQLEQRFTEKSVAQAHDALFYSLQQLDRGDWAQWDDAYVFIHDHNAVFQKSNLQNSAFQTMHIDALIFLDLQGHIVWGAAYDDRNNRQCSLPRDLLSYLSLFGPILTHTNAGVAIRNLIMLDSGPLWVTAQPILHTDSTGPVAGTIVMARYLGERERAQLESAIHYPCRFRRYADPALPPDFIAAQKHLKQPGAVFTNPLSKDFIAGYTVLPDILNRPALLLQVVNPRKVYAQGVKTVEYYVAILLLTGMIFCGLILWLLDVLVIKRLHRLSEEVRQISETGGTVERVTEQGYDELGYLARATNGMLVSLDHSHLALQQANDELEIRVEERTRQLRTVNDSLVKEVHERQQIEVALKEADKAKDEFLAVLSHELLTPLTCILGWSAEALTTGTTELMTHSMEIVHRNAVRQKRLVDEILEMSRLIHQKVELQFEPADLWEQASLAVENVQQIALEQRLQLQLEPPSTPLPITVDPVRIQQCIGNLLHNSLKFTPEGGSITVSCRREGESAVLRVQDSGRGISAEALVTIFDVFRQSDRDERAGGLGLGLTITRGIIELHGGHIEADSPGVGQGCTVTISLPIVVMAAEENEVV